ncbi:capsid protein [Gopherus associated circular DNA virus 4]|nr:capsid protein [Gopherus associated circular DNA virus 4]
MAYSRSRRIGASSMRRSTARWGRRVRKQARKEVLRLAESKRLWTYQVPLVQLSGFAANAFWQEQTIFNPLAPLSFGSLPVSVEGTEFIDPLIALNIAVTMDWQRSMAIFSRPVTVRVVFYLVAVALELTGIASTARPLTTTEQQEFWLRPPFGGLKPVLNTNVVTVIRKKSTTFSPRGISYLGNATGGALETRNIKMSARLRGTKQFQTSVTSTGEEAQAYLKGYNFYLLTVLMGNTTVPTAQLQGAMPVGCTADSFVYWKDF